MDHRIDTAVAASGLSSYLALTAVFGRRPGPLEQLWFSRVNDGQDSAWLRGPQQLGTPWALVGTAGVMAVRRRPVDVLAALLALPVEKGIEVLTKVALDRPRPAQVRPVALHDDAPVDGPSFPSGHGAIAAAAAYLLARTLPPAAGAVLATTTALASYVRVRQGAHWSTDAVAGTFLGAAVAAGLRVGVAELCGPGGRRCRSALARARGE